MDDHDCCYKERRELPNVVESNETCQQQPNLSGASTPSDTQVTQAAALQLHADITMQVMMEKLVAANDDKERMASTIEALRERVASLQASLSSKPASGGADADSDRQEIEQYKKREVELVEIIDDLRGTLEVMSSEYERLREGSDELGAAGNSNRIQTLEAANRNLNKGFYTREVALQDTIKVKEAEIEKAARQSAACVETMRKITMDLCGVMVGVESGTLGSLGSSLAFIPREDESKFQDTFPMSRDADLDLTPRAFSGFSRRTDKPVLYHTTDGFFMDDTDDDGDDESQD